MLKKDYARDELSCIAALKPAEASIPKQPLSKKQQFVADVLKQTESVVREICEQRQTALTEWQKQLREFALFVSQGERLAPSAFVRRIHELLPELHEAAMAATVYTYLASRTED